MDGSVVPKLREGWVIEDYLRQAKFWNRVTRGSVAVVLAGLTALGSCSVLKGGLGSRRYTLGLSAGVAIGLIANHRAKQYLALIDKLERVDLPRSPSERQVRRCPSLKRLLIDNLVTWAREGRFPSNGPRPAPDLADKIAARASRCGISEFRALYGKIDGVTRLNLSLVAGELTDEVDR
jgi:hypothetical protein